MADKKLLKDYTKEEIAEFSALEKEAYDKVIDKYTNESIGKLIEDYLVK